MLGGVGRTLITAGVLVLLFVGYQLWGTGLQEARSQKVLSREFDVMLQEVGADTSTTVAPTTTTAAAPGADGTGLRVEVEDAEPGTVDIPLPAEGDPIAKIRIPSIGVTRTVVEGIGLGDLKRGPGHDPASPLPGQAGNVAIAGHRTTYGQPFHNIDKVEIGDQVTFETTQGTFAYEVTESKIVDDSQTEILDDQGDDRITLIACHPKWRAEQRYILIGKLVGQPAPLRTGQAGAQEQARQADGDGALAAGTIDGDLGGEPASRAPVFLWGLVAAGIWFVTWLAHRVIRRRIEAARNADAGDPEPGRARLALAWTPYLLGLPAFLVALYVFFENFGRLLPGNY